MMYKLVADSCCDMTKALRKKLGLVSVPLKMILGTEEFVDDDSLDVDQFLAKMKAYKGRAISSCPSPSDYCDAFTGADFTFAVTLSANLSGSYGSAMVAKEMAEEKGTSVHVFDSKSASAGEILISLKIREMIDKGKEKFEIIEKIGSFIQEMKTIFVLENLDNLIKNGRMSKIVGQLATIMHIRPILGADSEGNIELLTKVRGSNKAIEKLAETIGESGKPTKGETVVITHCNNPTGADFLKKLITERYQFAQIHIVPTRGLSTMYANDGGVIMAY